jgi:hypothetical protein
MLVVYWKRLHNLDINPIENLWSLLGGGGGSSSRQMFIENLKKWNKIGQEVTVNLVNSMPRILQAITDA